MCDASTFAKIDLGANAAAGAIKTVSAFNDSKSRKKAAELKARQRAKKGEDEIRNAGIRTGRLFSAQRAAFAANGLDIAGSVTVRDVLADTSEEGVREAVQIRNNAAADVKAFEAEVASESPFLDATGEALGVGSRVASKWFAYKKAGVI